jgi:DNA-binding response OmpR family regulator
MDRSIDVHIMGLRQKLGDSGDMIETIRGIGYRFKTVRRTMTAR